MNILCLLLNNFRIELHTIPILNQQCSFIYLERKTLLTCVRSLGSYFLPFIKLTAVKEYLHNLSSSQFWLEQEILIIHP